MPENDTKISPKIFPRGFQNASKWLDFCKANQILIKTKPHKKPRKRFVVQHNAKMPPTSKNNAKLKSKSHQKRHQGVMIIIYPHHLPSSIIDPHVWVGGMAFSL